MHAHGWHGRSVRRCAPRVPGAAAAERPVSGAAWRTGVMSNGVVVRDRRTAILAIGRWKCIATARTCDAGAGFAGNAWASFNNAVLYLNRANNVRRSRSIGLRSRVRCAARVFV
ncbi:hypothetical protein DIE06_31805 [Burkholderia sp. Bp8998]|nr:hypothetical protein DIE06_31805 [Burkholderia sp. Bp8998]